MGMSLLRGRPHIPQEAFTLNPKKHTPCHRKTPHTFKLQRFKGYLEAHEWLLSRGISMPTMLRTRFRALLTELRTTHEPPSRSVKGELRGQAGAWRGCLINPISL